MIKDNDEILEPINKEWQVPEGYFQNMEDRILGTYHKRQRIRRRKVLLSITCVLVLAVVGVFYAKFDFGTKNPIDLERLATITPTTTPPVEVTTDNEIAKVEIENTNIEKTITNTQIKGKKRTSYSQKDKIGYNERELSYLENYLNEDTYELIYNSLVK